MIRIKVIRASHLLVGVAVALLVIVLAVFVINYAMSGGDRPVAFQWTQAPGATEGAAVEVAAAFSVGQTTKTEDGVIELSFDAEVIHEDEHTDMTVEIIVPKADESSRAQSSQAPRVLIYHTHTHEAYEQVDGDEYIETTAWRTADPSHSIVKVGEALSLLLKQRGFEVVHDTTDHEPPKLNTAYSRSLVTLESYADTPFDLYIDLHRDAYSKSYGMVALSANNQEMAKLMLLIGRGDNFKVKPNYEDNLAFAQQLTTRLNEIVPGICRDVMVKENRYNQHVGTPAVIIEVGHNMNTLEQALNSMPYLADAIDDVLVPSDGERDEHADEDEDQGVVSLASTP